MGVGIDLDADIIFRREDTLPASFRSQDSAVGGPKNSKKPFFGVDIIPKYDNKATKNTNRPGIRGSYDRNVGFD
jgi:hypothetical protein